MPKGVDIVIQMYTQKDIEVRSKDARSRVGYRPFETVIANLER